MRTFAHVSLCEVRQVTAARIISLVEERRMSRRARSMCFSMFEFIPIKSLVATG